MSRVSSFHPPPFIREKADWDIFQSLTDHPNIVTYLSELGHETMLSRFASDFSQRAIETIPQTKSYDKAKPWECWWFDDMITANRPSTTFILLFATTLTNLRLHEVH